MDWLLSLMQGTDLAVIAVVGGLIAAVVAFFRGQSSGKASLQSKIDRNSLKAERERNKLDDEIQQDVDLVPRAKRAGIVRPDEPGEHD